MSHFLGKNIHAEQSNSWIHLGGTIDWVNAQESDDKHSSKEQTTTHFQLLNMLNINHPVFQHRCLQVPLYFACHHIMKVVANFARCCAKLMTCEIYDYWAIWACVKYFDVKYFARERVRVRVRVINFADVINFAWHRITCGWCKYELCLFMW